MKIRNVIPREDTGIKIPKTKIESSRTAYRKILHIIKLKNARVNLTGLTGVYVDRYA